MDTHLLKTRNTQLGGLCLVHEYARLGVLWPMVKAMARNPLSRQSYKNAYAVALRRVEKLLQEKYRPGSSEWGGIGNWFISAYADNLVLTVLREMLQAYWKDYDCVLDYYIFHLFFSMLRDVFPEEIGAMPYAYAPRSLAWCIIGVNRSTRRNGSGSRSVSASTN